MSENNVDNLKTYLRADYVRQIAAENRDKPIQERWRLIRDSAEHRHREHFARSRAKWILIIGLSTLLAFCLVMVLLGVSPDDPTNLRVGSYRFPDWLMMSISILMGLAIGVAGWLIGNRRARQQLAASGKP